MNGNKQSSLVICITTLRHRQNGHFFIDSIFKCILINENVWTFFLTFFLGVQLTIFQHWFRYWLGAEQARSHFLNQWCEVYWHISMSLGLHVHRTQQGMKSPIRDPQAPPVLLPEPILTLPYPHSISKTSKYWSVKKRVKRCWPWPKVVGFILKTEGPTLAFKTTLHTDNIQVE